MEINDDVRGKYNRKGQIKFKTAMLKQKLCDYSDAYILVKGAIKSTGQGSDAATEWTDERYKNY